MIWMRYLVLSVVVASSALVVTPPAIRGQDAAGSYLPPLKIDPNLEEKTKGNRDAFTARNRVLSGAAAFDDAGRNDLRNWYEGYVFKAMTYPDKSAVLHQLRGRVLSDIELAALKSQPAHDYLVNLTFAQMRPLVEQNHHPAVRVNAMLLIGELNQTERVPGASAAVPLPATLAYLREQLKSAAQIDAVRIAALAGILRHVESQWFLNARPADDVITGLTQEMLALAAPEPPAKRSLAAHNWMRGRAIDVLGSLCGWLPTPEAVAALQGTLADPKTSILLRCRAAYALGRVNFASLPNANQLDWNATVNNLGGLLADACDTEVKLFDALKAKSTSAAGSSFGAPGMGPGMAPGMASGAPGGDLGSSAGGASSSPDEAGGAPSGMMPGGMPGGMAGGMMPGGMAGGMMPGFGMGGGRGMAGAPQHTISGSRRRLLYELACVRAAVAGPTAESDFKGVKPLAAANPAAAPGLKKLETALAELEEALKVKPDELDLDDLLKTIRTRGQELAQMRPEPEAESGDGDVPDTDAPAADVPAPGGAAEAAADNPADNPADVPPAAPPATPDAPPAGGNPDAPGAGPPPGN